MPSINSPIPMDVVIDQTTADDFKLYHGNPVATAHLEMAREAIQNGKKVFFVRDYANAPREVTRVLSTSDEVDAWESEMKQATKLFRQKQN